MNLDEKLNELLKNYRKDLHSKYKEFTSYTFGFCIIITLLSGVNKTMVTHFAQFKTQSNRKHSHLEALMQEMLGLLKLIDRDMSTMRTSIEMKQIKISRWLPMNSKKGMRRFFRNDEGYNERMSMASIMLEDGCDYESTNKHAISFVRILFNNEFRSIHVWRKSEITNRRPEMHYDVIYSLPADVRTWVRKKLH